jgi:hypothetical protein
MFEHPGSGEPLLEGGPDKDPASAGSTHSMAGITYLTVIDVVFLLASFGWLFAFCNDFDIDWSSGAAILTALHLTHAALIVLACYSVSWDVLTVPIFFLVGGFLVVIIDTFVLVQRGYIVFANNSPQIDCDFFLFFFDFGLWAVAASYCVYSTVSVSRFGHFHVRTQRGPLLLAMFDLGLLFFLLAFLVLVCGSGGIPADRRESLLHAIHFVLAISTCIAFQNDALLVPAWFILLGTIAVFLDGYVFLSITADILENGISFDCTTFLWFVAIIFTALSIAYLGLGCATRSRYGLCGDPDDVGDLFIDKYHRPTDEKELEGISEQEYVRSVNSKARFLASAVLDGRSSATIKKQSKDV